VTRDAAPVSYRADIQPLFNTQCVFCHVVGAENGEQDLSRRVSHTELMQPSSQAPMPRVTPGDPKASYLLHKLRGTQLEAGGNGNAMPIYDPPRPFDDASLERVRRWIAEGAENN
jgi:mono/diheme cytochrome c family protein